MVSRLSLRQQFVLAYLTLETPVSYSELRRVVINEVDLLPKDSTDASFSRTLRLLAERGLIFRYSHASRIAAEQITLPIGVTHSGANTEYVGLRYKGEAVGQEIIAKHRDGRYSLNFSNLPD